MFGWSINLFRVRGIQLALHGSFFLLLAYVGFEGWREQGWVGLGLSVAALCAFFTCVVLHELGHSFTAMHFGIGVRRILLMPIGGMAQFDDIPRSPGRELWITIAGPAVNFVIALALFLVVGLPRGWEFFSFPDYPGTIRGFAQMLLHWNLWMGCFNLAPVFPMDGGRILRALLATRLPYLQATFVAATLGKVLAVAGAVTALFFMDPPRPLTAILFGFIFLVGEAEYRSAVRRELDDAEWRELAARAYQQRAERGLDQPPVLPPS